uniref:superoxide dismutase n=1 Tax=Amblyomma triste TaxID=251400 RepID=A0A023G585_AMBTT
MGKDVLLLSLLTVIVTEANGQEPITDAVCVFQIGTPRGYVKFHQDPGQQVQLEGNITQLAPGEHGFHVHEFGDLTDGCTSAGSHYNPFGKSHGAPYNEDRHVGDLGNIKADDSSSAVFSFSDRLLQLNGDYSIIGRSLVVHEDRDDLGRGNFSDSLTTGHSGARLTCCVIGIAP